MRCVQVDGLPDDPLLAAARFHAAIVPPLRDGGDDVLLIFPPAGHEHRGWRAAALTALARALAPRRINAVTGPGAAALASATAYLAAAPGVTGQVLVLDDRDRRA